MIGRVNDAEGTLAEHTDMLDTVQSRTDGLECRTRDSENRVTALIECTDGIAAHTESLAGRADLTEGRLATLEAENATLLATLEAEKATLAAENRVLAQRVQAVEAAQTASGGKTVQVVVPTSSDSGPVDSETGVKNGVACFQ